MRHPAEVVECDVTVGGMRLHYQRAGCGPALILIHGLVGSGRNWELNIGFLSRSRTVYALDLANMGESERVPGIDAGLAASADRLADAMTALGLASADLAGYSHGGSIALMFAARHPQRVRRLVLFAPANPFCELAKPLIGFYRTRPGMWLARRIPRLPRAVHSIALSRMYGDSARVAQGALEGYTAGLNNGSIDHVLGVVRGWNEDMMLLRAALSGSADWPATLLIWGDRDRAVGLPSGHRLAEVLGERLLVLPGVGHLSFAETPEVCNRAMREWLG